LAIEIEARHSMTAAFIRCGNLLVELNYISSLAEYAGNHEDSILDLEEGRECPSRCETRSEGRDTSDAISGYLYSSRS
jgi:hypothetical protein